MKHIENILTFLTTLVVIVIIGWLVYWGIQYVIDQFNMVDPSIAAILTIIAVLAITCTIIISRTISSVIKAGDKPIHPEKSVIYKKFLDVWYPTSSGYEDQYIDLDKAMSLWASDGVLKQYLNLRNASGSSDIQDTMTRLRAEKVLLAMRKDLGQQNFGIRNGSINTMLTEKGPSDNIKN